MRGVDQPEKSYRRLLQKKPLDQRVVPKPPLINIVKFACNACEDNVYRVTNAWVVLHTLSRDLSKAISFVDKAYIDQEKCIQCGMCKGLPYRGNSSPHASLRG